MAFLGCFCRCCFSLTSLSISCCLRDLGLAECAFSFCCNFLRTVGVLPLANARPFAELNKALTALLDPETLFSCYFWPATDAKSKKELCCYCSITEHINKSRGQLAVSNSSNKPVPCPVLLPSWCHIVPLLGFFNSSLAGSACPLVIFMMVAAVVWHILVRLTLARLAVKSGIQTWIKVKVKHQTTWRLDVISALLDTWHIVRK